MRDDSLEARVERAKSELGSKYCLAKPVSRIRHEGPLALRLASNDALFAELRRRGAL